MARRGRQLPTYTFNGWLVEKQPSSFASRFAYVATAVDTEGYQTAYHGFFSLRDARAFCEANEPPKAKA